MGIKKDIGLVNDDYQWLGSMFYFGRLAILERPLFIFLLMQFRLPCL